MYRDDLPPGMAPSNVAGQYLDMRRTGSSPDPNNPMIGYDFQRRFLRGGQPAPTAGGYGSPGERPVQLVPRQPRLQATALTWKGCWELPELFF